MPVDIEKLEELAKAASPLPWRTNGWCIHDANGMIPVADIRFEKACDQENARYIVAACNAVPELLKMYREADDEAADANSAWQKVRRENLALQERVRELEVKLEVYYKEKRLEWERSDAI